MTSEQIIALIGAALLAFIVRVFNVVVQWLARVLRVQPPEPIPTSAPGVVDAGTEQRPTPSGYPSKPEQPPDLRQ